MVEAVGANAELPRAHLFGADFLMRPWCQPLNNPVWTGEYGHVRDDDPILGLYLDRQAWALPWWIMKNHHVGNLPFDAGPVLVTLCEMCSSSSAFRSEVDGQRLVFRLRGVYNATILLDDLATGSLWSPFAGVALAGPMRGAVLERLPISQCRWVEWLALHPATRVLYAEQVMREGHGHGHSPGSPGIEPRWLTTLERPLDQRLPHNALVLSVENGASARAYPVETLASIGPVLNDSLGDKEIVLRSRPGTLQALAFDRRVGREVLVFRHSESRGVYDEQTGSVWNEMGEAISGPLAGTELAYVHSGIEEWYVWAAYRPDTELFAAR